MSSPKYAFISGASSGIGYQLAVLLSKRGYKVYGCAPESALWEIQPLVAKYGVVPLACDITKLDDIKRAADFIGKETGGRLDVLYNNAGISFGGLSVEFDDDKLEQIFHVNVIGHIYMTKYMVDYVIAAKGCVVFTSLVAARVPLSWVGPYCSTKAAIDQYAQVLHGELAPFGVRVHSVITGGVDTAICDTNATTLLSGSRYDVPATYDSMWASGNMSRNARTNISPEAYAEQVTKKITARRDPGFNLYHGAAAYFLHVFLRVAPFWLIEWGIAWHFKQLRVWLQLKKLLREREAKKNK